VFLLLILFILYTQSEGTKIDLLFRGKQTGFLACFGRLNPEINVFCEMGNRRLETSIPASQNSAFLRYRNHLADAVFRVQLSEI